MDEPFDYSREYTFDGRMESGDRDPVGPLPWIEPHKMPLHMLDRESNAFSSGETLYTLQVINFDADGNITSEYIVGSRHRLKIARANRYGVIWDEDGVPHALERRPDV